MSKLKEFAQAVDEELHGPSARGPFNDRALRVIEMCHEITGDSHPAEAAVKDYGDSESSGTDPVNYP